MAKSKSTCLPAGSPRSGATTPLEARAVAIAYELHRLLGQIYDLPEHGPGSSVEKSWDLMDEVIECVESAFLPALRVRDRFEIRQMRAAGVSIADCAKYFDTTEVAISRVLGSDASPG